MTKNIIVTGAASGIGLACAKQLLREGKKVAVLDIAADALKDHFARDKNAIPVRLDAGSMESCRSATEDAVKSLGSIDALIHFAAIWSGTTWDKSEKSEWDRIL